MAGLLSRAFPPGLLLIALGIMLIGLAAVFDHYDLHRAQWYVGEGGLVALSLGAVMAVVAVIALFLTPAGEDGDG